MWFQFISMVVTIFVAVLTGWQLESPRATLDTQIFMIDDVVIYFFVAELALKLVAEGDRPTRYFTDPSEGVYNCIDAAVAIGSIYSMCAEETNVDGHFSFQRFAVARAVRLCRLIHLTHLFPNNLTILTKELNQGLKAALMTIALMAVFILAASVLCVTLLGGNDPAAFGDLGQSVVTLFRVATLTSWSSLAYTAIFGCDVFDGAGYTDGSDADSVPKTIQTQNGGRLKFWKCQDPESLPPGGTEVFFVAFTVISAFVMVGLMTASIVMSVYSQYLASKDEKQPEVEVAPGSPIAVGVESIFSASPVEKVGVSSLSHTCFQVESSRALHFLASLSIVAEAAAAVLEVDHAPSEATRTVHALSFAVFAGDILARVGSHAAVVEAVEFSCGRDKQIDKEHLPLSLSPPSSSSPCSSLCCWSWRIAWRQYLANGCNVGDVVFVGATAAYFAMRSGTKTFLMWLNVVRVLRLYRAALVFPLLRCLVNALANGLALSLGVVAYLLVFNYVLACIGVMSFASNDPFHFASLRRSALSVWRMETGDEWDQILGINMYGCAAYPLGYPMVQSASAGDACEEEHSVARGFWAFAYVATAVLVGGLLAPSVVVGLMCVSFAEAWEDYVEERAASESLKALSKQQREGVPSESGNSGSSGSSSSRRGAWWNETENLLLLKCKFAMLAHRSNGATKRSVVRAADAHQVFRFAFFKFVASPSTLSLKKSDRGGEEKDDEEKDDDDDDGGGVVAAAEHPAVLGGSLTLEQVKGLRRIFKSTASWSHGGDEPRLDKPGFRTAARLGLRLPKLQRGMMERELPDKDLDAAFEVANAINGDGCGGGTGFIGQEAFVAIMWRAVEGDVLGASGARGADTHAHGRRQSFRKWSVEVARKQEESPGSPPPQPLVVPSSASASFSSSHHPAVREGALSEEHVNTVRLKFQESYAASNPPNSPVAPEEEETASQTSRVRGLGVVEYRHLLRSLFEECGEYSLKLIPNSDLDTAFEIASTTEAQSGRAVIEQEPFVAVFWRALEGDMVGVGGAKEAKAKVGRIASALTSTAAAAPANHAPGTACPRCRSLKHAKRRAADGERDLEGQLQAMITASGARGSVVSFTAFVAFCAHVEMARSPLRDVSAVVPTAEEVEEGHDPTGAAAAATAAAATATALSAPIRPPPPTQSTTTPRPTVDWGECMDTESHKHAVEAQRNLDAILAAQAQASAASPSSMSRATAIRKEEEQAEAVAVATAARDEAVALDEACKEVWAHVLSSMAKHENEAEWEESIQEVFQSLDQDGDGEVDVEELGAGLTRFLGHSLTQPQLSAFRENLDEDEDGRISLKEFLQAARWEKRKQDARAQAPLPQQPSSHDGDEDDGMDASSANEPTATTSTTPQRELQEHQQQQQQHQRGLFKGDAPSASKHRPAAASNDDDETRSGALPSSSARRMDERCLRLLHETGLADLEHALSNAGLTSIPQLDVAENEALAACGLRKGHIAKLRRAVFEQRGKSSSGGRSDRRTAESSSTGGCGKSAGNAAHLSRGADAGRTRGMLRADAQTKFTNPEKTRSTSSSSSSLPPPPPHASSQPSSNARRATTRLSLKPGPGGVHNQATTAAGRVAAQKQAKINDAANREERRRIAREKGAQRVASRARGSTRNFAPPGPAAAHREPSPSDFISPTSPRGTHL